MNGSVLPLRKISKNDVDLCGGKGASLGELMKIGMPVPEGFVVTTEAYEKFLADNKLGEKIQQRLSEINFEDSQAVEFVSDEIKKLIVEDGIDPELKKEILETFDKLGAAYVAVRSSATAEDATKTSFAGQLSTYLNTNRDALIGNIKRCWASLFSPRALTYLGTHDLLEVDISVAVIVQQMVNAEVSGIAFTAHPVTKDKDMILIESGFGLGEAMVSGMITPDSYVVDKKGLTVYDFKIGKQKKMVTKDGVVDVVEKKQTERKLDEGKAIELAKLCIQIEKHYGAPQDIEWAIEKDKIYVLQSRPITAL